MNGSAQVIPPPPPPFTACSDWSPGLSEQVAAHREQRADRTLRALEALSGAPVGRPRPGSVLDYALLHHALERCSAAARSGDSAEAHSALALWAGREDLPRLPGAGETMAVEATHMVSHHPPGFDDPVYCVTDQAVVGAGRAHQQAFHDILITGRALAVTAGFEPLLTDACGVVVRTGTQAPGLLPHSYALSFLPGTVFMEQPEAAETAGEVLVHESSHSWLNECLAAEGAVLPAQPWLHSPWRGEPRPPHGILHAAFAFSNVVLYLASLQERPAGADCPRQKRLTAECRVFTAHRRDIDRVLALVPSPAVRELVGERLSLVDALGPDARPR